MHKLMKELYYLSFKNFPFKETKIPNFGAVFNLNLFSLDHFFYFGRKMQTLLNETSSF
jgi:hypothetical protein